MPTRYGQSPWIDRFPKSRVPSYPAHRGASRRRRRSSSAAGLTGCATAYAFAAHGVHVALVEADRIGRGVTAAAAGWITDDPGVGFGEIEKALGLRAARRAWQAWRRAALDVAALAAPARRQVPSRTAHGRSSSRRRRSEAARLKREQKARRAAGLDAPLAQRASHRRRDGADGRGRHPHARRGHPRSVSRLPGSRRGGGRPGRQAVRTVGGEEDHVRPQDRRPADRRRHDSHAPDRRRDRIADGALQGAAAAFLVPARLPGADRTGAGPRAPSSRLARRDPPRHGRAAARRALGGRRTPAHRRRGRRGAARPASRPESSFSAPASSCTSSRRSIRRSRASSPHTAGTRRT